MNKLLRFYNQNRKKIFIVIFSIIILIMLLNAFKEMLKKSSEREEQAYNNYINEQKQKEYKENPDIKKTISDIQVEEKKELIVDQFIRYCNAGQIENAYNLLTDDCKSELYPTIEVFINNYFKIVFNTTKLYSKEIYSGNTYKVKLYEDMLSTGNVSSGAIEDYYTIEKNDNVAKLNISNYIGSKKINKSASNDKLNVSVVSKKIFKEYEIYTIEIQNLTNKSIILDSMEDTKSTYLTGNGDVKYYCLVHEKVKNDLNFN